MLRKNVGVFSRRFFATRTDSDYQFLTKTSLPMMHFQKSLPRLPIPELSATCERYLSALRPLLTTDQHARTSKLVEEFQNGAGKDLQDRLKAYDNSNLHTSYISEPWFDMYLSDRVPLPVNYTPVLGMTNPRDPPDSVAVQTANLLVTSARFMKALRAEYLIPEVFHMNPKTADSGLYNAAVKMAPSKFATYVSYAFKSFPLDMSQYQGLFSATRIPQLGKDKIFRAAQDPKHFIVLRKGNIYRLDVLDRDGNIEPAEVILGRVQQLLDVSSRDAEPTHPLGLMTTEHRDTWANLRQHLTSLSEKNQNNLKIIDSGIMCIYLDDIVYAPGDELSRFTDLLYSNVGNRWFDKSMAIAVSSDSKSAVTIEHSWGDGVAVLRYINDMFKEISKNPIISNTTASRADSGDFMEKLDFDYDDKMKSAIQQAKLNHDKVEKSLAANYIDERGVGKKLCKTAKVSPDSVAQFAIQLAYAYVSNGGTTATYESCSTAAFRCGRTETVRPATLETQKLCKALLSKAKLDEITSAEVSMMRDCSNKHNKLTKEAAMGQGFDRHLFVLRYIAQKNGLDLPELYRDQAYSQINHNILSTSTLSSPAIDIGGFGPVVGDGYGIGYQIDNDRLGAIVTTYHAKRNGKEFVEALAKATGQIQRILELATKAQ
ncbi:carnitine O-palmitoyltransferase 2, mitochondrial [Sergentomyia squamirostris]